jgi:hypothetical protein
MTVAFRACPAAPRVTVAFRIYLGAMTVYIGLYVLTALKLKDIFESFRLGSVWLDLLCGFFALAASLFGGWLQLYNLANRGYSLRMLIDLLDAPQCSMTAEEMVTRYAQGRGLRWMYDTRLDGLLQTQLVSANGDTIALTSRGRSTARAFLWLRAFYLIEDLPR